MRSCRFSFAAKILTPVDDLLVPLIKAEALADITGRSGIAGVIATPDLADRVPSTLGLAIADDPIHAHHDIHVALARMPGRLWNDFDSEIDSSATISPAAWVAPRNVRVGPGVVVMAGAVVAERVVIGAGTRIHPRAVIGSDAYEIVMLDGNQSLRPQTGGVEIGARCEILAGTIVTRSAFCGATTIHDHSVIDGNAVISHDCRIGRNVRIGGGAWIGGRVAVGDGAALGPNCTIGNGLRVGASAKISLGSVVTRDVAEGGHVSGNFAIDHGRMLDHLRSIR